MREFEILLNDFTLQNLHTFARLYYGYIVVLAIAISIVWLLRFFSKHEPTGVDITELYDEHGRKKEPMDMKPVIRVIIIDLILIGIYIAIIYL